MRPVPPAAGGEGLTMELWFNYLDQILLYVALALSLNLLLGYAGQVSVAHAAFGAIGGYAMGYLAAHPRLELPARHAARHGAWRSSSARSSPSRR